MWSQALREPFELPRALLQVSAETAQERLALCVGLRRENLRRRLDFAIFTMLCRAIEFANTVLCAWLRLELLNESL